VFDIQIAQLPPRYEVVLSAENKPTVILTTSPNFEAEIYPLIRFLKGDQGEQGIQGIKGDPGEGVLNFTPDPLIPYILAKS
jgi:hypothetical protein